MTKSKLLVAGLIATAMLAGPVAAREYHPSTQHFAARAGISAPFAAPDEAYASAPAPYTGGVSCYPAPRVGQFASQPWDNDVPCEPTPGY
jgi:hypothetical protein